MLVQALTDVNSGTETCNSSIARLNNVVVVDPVRLGAHCTVAASCWSRTSEGLRSQPRVLVASAGSRMCMVVYANRIGGALVFPATSEMQRSFLVLSRELMAHVTQALGFSSGSAVQVVWCGAATPEAPGAEGAVAAAHARGIVCRGAYRESHGGLLIAAGVALQASSDSPPLTSTTSPPARTTPRPWLLFGSSAPCIGGSRSSPQYRQTLVAVPVSALHGVLKRGLANHPGQPRPTSSQVPLPDSALHETLHPPQLALPRLPPALLVTCQRICNFPLRPASSPRLSQSPQRSTYGHDPESGSTLQRDN
ncbi:hypothetical protein PSPO01_06134 [Paraphaeosphaeria sporulosa]